MIDKLDNELRFQQDAMSLRAERQQVLANNIANADTPNFRARDFDFSAELASSLQKSHTQGRGMILIGKYSATGQIFALFACVAIIYFVLNYSLSTLARWKYKKLRLNVH